MKDHDPETGEVLEHALVDQETVAADNLPVPKRSRSASNVLAMLDDGEFNADLSEAIHELLKQIEGHAHRNKGQAKGQVDVKLQLSYANGMLVIVPDFKVKAPVEKRGGTALFIGEDMSLGRNPPGQRAMFGSKARDPDADMREVRDA